MHVRWDFVLRGLPRLLLAGGLLLSAPAVVSAQQGDASLPAASELVARYVAALGGRDAMLRHTSIRSTGQFELPAAGLRGQLELVQAQPNRMMMRLTIPGMGVINSGFDGTHGWSVDPMQGARLLQGRELAAMRDQADFSAALRDAHHFQSMEAVERTELGGEPCYQVKLVWTSGRESYDCYHTETGLLVGTVATQESPMGSVEVVNLLSDYRDFGGLQVATRMRQQMMGMEQILTIDAVAFDAVDAAAMEPPAEVRSLIEQQPASGSGRN